ncbi:MULTISPECIES: hypothetical protein [unclassified Legionella]|uniref:hypothetical protein n=1 Tax=unclassified Legionella TaxID=2622702 RepID=UPI001055B0AB|nr:MULTISPECIES: hypothetical protein [unclassified Legionella]MDI9817995.1 hypothetical protein [Legionella sp. PL877]
MVDYAQYQNFLIDKQTFFGNIKMSNDKKNTAENSAFSHDYGFIATNKLLIEQEFNQLFTSLRQHGSTNDAFWFYCYYCCLMLKNYYLAYKHKGKVKEYDALLERLKQCMEKQVSSQSRNNEDYLTALGKQIGQDLGDLAATPMSLSKLRDKVAASNLNRIYWFFCRTTVANSLRLARDLQWMEKLGNLLGKKIDVEAFIHTLEVPNDILRFLSVGFFAVRFIMNAGVLMKHTLFPSEKERKLDWKKRFSNEIYKRHAVFLNDLVWGTVNLLTNYNEAFGIAAPVAGWMVAGFMAFDVCLILWRRHLEEREYLTKRSQYTRERDYYGAKLNTKLDPTERLEYEEHYKMLTRQLEKLELSWKTSDATYLFNASAALLLMAGFSASMLLTPPVMVLGCYLVCTFAVAMYLSDGAYSKYKEKSLLLEEAEVAKRNIPVALKDYQAARNDFIFTLAKNAIIPTLLITTFAVCWQAALLLAAVYIGYELYRSYSKHKQTQLDAIAPVMIEPDDEVSGLGFQLS